jgi:hypothetical protein
MLKLKPRLATENIPPQHLRRKRCSVCRKSYAGHYASRQCSHACRAEAIRARGRVSSQRIRDERREPLPGAKCAWCKKPMNPERTTRRTCSDACRAALYRSNRARNKAAAQADASARKAPSQRRIDVREWPNAPGCTFDAKWADGLKVQVQVAGNVAVLTADAWVEEIQLSPDHKCFVCLGCERQTPILEEGPEHFLCAECIAQHERR